MNSIIPLWSEADGIILTLSSPLSHSSITFSQYLALLTIADAFLASSLREGMNLTTHEYVVCQEEKHRPLILSEFTGTYSGLRACIGINPWNTKQVGEFPFGAFRSLLLFLRRF